MAAPLVVETAEIMGLDYKGVGGPPGFELLTSEKEANLKSLKVAGATN